MLAWAGRRGPARAAAGGGFSSLVSASSGRSPGVLSACLRVKPVYRPKADMTQIDGTFLKGCARGLDGTGPLENSDTHTHDAHVFILA